MYRPAEFEEAVRCDTYLEHHKDLFTHPLCTYRHGVSKSQVQQVVRRARLPLIDCEAEGAEMFRAKKVECLTIFLMPPSLEEYEVGERG